VAYECLSGTLPFTADSPVTVAVMQIRNVPPPLPPDVPPPVRAVVERAMAKDSRWRYANGGELARAVAAAKEGRFEQPPPLPPGPGAPPMRPGPGQNSGPLPVGVPIHPLSGPLNQQGQLQPGQLNQQGMPMPAPKRHGRRLILVVGLLATAVLAAVVVWLIVHRGDARDTGSATSHRETVATPKSVAGSVARPSSPGNGAPGGNATSAVPSQSVADQIQLDPQKYLDHPLDDVLRDLRGQGLQPTLADTGDATATEETKGTVKALMAPPGHVLRTPTWLPTGSQVLVVGTPHNRPNQHIAAGTVGTVVHPKPLSEQQANR
jgi:serine/threonine-protein kinase